MIYLNITHLASPHPVLGAGFATVLGREFGLGELPVLGPAPGLYVRDAMAQTP